MAKLTLTDVLTLQDILTPINLNNAAIETAVENTLSRDGTSPNTMEANLDMNSNRILNLPLPVADQEPVRLQDLISFEDFTALLASQIGYTAPFDDAVELDLEEHNSAWISVRNFGAVGDGVTNDTNAFLFALATGKKVWVPYTSTGYSFGTDFINLDDGQQLEGESYVKIKGTGSKLVRLINYDKPARLSNLTLDMDGASAGSKAVVAGISSAVVWRTEMFDLVFDNCYTAIGTESHATNYVVDWKFRNIEILHPKGTSIDIPRSRGFIQLHQVFVDHTLSGTPTQTGPAIQFADYQGLEFNQVDYVGAAVSGSGTFDANVIGIKITSVGAAAGFGRYVWLNRTRAEGSLGYGIQLLSIPFLHLNEVESHGGLGHGIYAESCTLVSGQDVNVRGVNDGSGGAAGSNGLFLNGCSQWTISNLMFDNCLGSGLTLTNTTNCLFSTCRSENNTRYGIEETGTSNGNIIVPYYPNGNTIGTHVLVGSTSRVITGKLIVEGPTSATSGNLASYSGTTGKLIQDAGTPAAVVAGAAGANGLIARTGATTLAARTLTAPAAGITVTNGDGVSGNPTLVLANDLSALEGLSSTGFAVRSATDTWIQVAYVAPTSWTPGIAFGGGSTGVTYAGQIGNYFRIGDEVIAYFYLELTSNGTSTGAVTITGLPVTSANQTYNFGAVSNIQGASGMVGLGGPIIGRVGPNVSTCSLFTQGATGTSAITEANVGDTAAIMGTIRYRV